MCKRTEFRLEGLQVWKIVAKAIGLQNRKLTVFVWVPVLANLTFLDQ